MNNNKPKSALGALLLKWENSGINGGPIIEDKELLELETRIKEQISISEDIGDVPNKVFWLHKVSSINLNIEARELAKERSSK